MAVKSPTQPSLGKILRFVVRFLGLNGLVAAAVGAVLWLALGYEEAGLIVVIAGASAVALWLLAEVRGMAGAVASHRGAAGANVLLQVALASTLIVGANVYSFSTYKRFDCTAKKIFTLDETIRARLAQMRGETDIIVYLQHVSFGQRVELRQDEYDQAAEKIIIDKVRDLAEQFSERGPRFHVHILDTQKKTYKDREKGLKAISEELVATIKKAPEDSIFFYTRDTKHIQRLSFNDIYQLDKKASEEANNKHGNLVLIDQGVENFAEKIFKIEEKKPRIGFAVAHGWLGQEGTEEYGMPGLKKALESRGFEGRDILLKKYPEFEAAALEHEEGRYEVLDAQIHNLRDEIKEFEEELQDVRKDKDYWSNKTGEEINKEFVLVQTTRGMLPMSRAQLEIIRKEEGRIPFTIRINETFRVEWVKQLTAGAEFYETEIPLSRSRLEKATTEQGKLRVENLAEQRRITDVRAKFNRLLADVDLLVVPRWTLINVMRREAINSRLYPLEETQLEAIKDFMKAGKPVLFCLGPMNDASENGPESTKQDSLETLLERFNIQLPNQTILFNSEADAMAERSPRDQMRGAVVEIPPAELDWKIPAGARGFGSMDVNAAPPIRVSLRLTGHGLGDKSRAGLKVRHPRPVYVVRTSWSPEHISGAVAAISLGWPAGPSQSLADFYGKINTKFDEKTVFLMTNADSWNEEKPLPTDKPRYSPRFKRPKSDDPHKGTVSEKRRGPFPIGVALEADVPLDWYEKDGTQKPKKVRLAVIGQGGIFVGDRLAPMREKLFLDVSNWLLGRENLLAKESATWQYPRVEVEPETKNLWAWSMRAGLPVLFLCLGINVWLVRRMR